MRRLLTITLIALMCLNLAPAFAADGPLTTDPPALTLTGVVGGGNMAASLRLLPNQTLTEVRLYISDLASIATDARPRDPMPANTFTVMPATEFMTLTQGSLTQVTIQVAPPAFAGSYTGTLVVHWLGPQPGQLLVPVTVLVRARPALGLQSASQVTLGGEPGQFVSRQVTLRETTAKGTPLSGLRAIPQDLLTTEGAMLGSSRIQVELPADKIAGGDLLTATLKVNLQGVQPGTYAGEVLFGSDTGDLVSLPVTVNVKAGPALPLIVLAVGLAVGLYLSAYQGNGKQRDELIVRVVAVRKWMEDDADLNDGFGPRLNPLLAKADAAIRARQWNEARTAAQDAENLITKWRGGAQAWATQIKYLKNLIQTRFDDVSAYPTLQALHLHAQDLADGAADKAKPSELHSAIGDLEHVLARFEAVNQRLEDIGEARANAPDSLAQKKKEWTDTEKKLGVRLGHLPADKVPLDRSQEWDDLEKQVEALGQEVAKAVEEALRQASSKEPGNADTSLGVRGDVLDKLLEAIQPLRSVEAFLPSVGPFKPADAKGASWRLDLYTWLTYGVGGLVFALWGFNNLYLAQAAFGKSLADYMTLLAWGLGGQTTFTAVIDLFRGWGVSFGKSGSNA